MTIRSYITIYNSHFEMYGEWAYVLNSIGLACLCEWIYDVRISIKFPNPKWLINIIKIIYSIDGGS